MEDKKRSKFKFSLRRVSRDLEHPLITKIHRAGSIRNDPDKLRQDAFRKPIYEDDELIIIEDLEFIVDELSGETVEVLEMLGATYDRA